MNSANADDEEREKDTAVLSNEEHLSRNRLKEEIDSWKPYADALRAEDRAIFKDMMNAISSVYGEAIETAGRGYNTEAIMMSILLNQQKAINWLSNLVEKYEKKSRAEEKI